MPGLDLRGRKVGGFRYFSSFVAAPDFATVAPQKIHVPGGKNNITGNHSQMGKRPEGGMRPERAAGRKKHGEAGTSGASHAGKTTLQVYNALQCWWVERVGGKTVERGTATLQAYNVLQCWWLVRETIPRKTNPAGVQRLAALVVGQRRTTSCSVGGWSEDTLNGPSPRSYDRVAHRHISVTTGCVTTRTPSLQGIDWSSLATALTSGAWDGREAGTCLRAAVRGPMAARRSTARIMPSDGIFATALAGVLRLTHGSPRQTVVTMDFAL
ncbi:hypothetical protein B0H14DRAFT_2565731 [Mycena olivaceomarginata]|nr:hypothetical protein B0H14DRAFT_2565731 [Mycena olivaceomarginata]